MDEKELGFLFIDEHGSWKAEKTVFGYEHRVKKNKIEQNRF